jgi:hypothetical protein
MTEKLLKEISRKLTAIESLIILQLIQGGTSTAQISEVLKVESINPSNISDSLPVKKLKKRNEK